MVVVPSDGDGDRPASPIKKVSRKKRGKKVWKEEEEEEGVA